MTPNEKAERAKQLLEDPLLKLVFDEIRMQLVGNLEHSGMSDVDTQHEIALTLQLLKRLREQMYVYINDQTLENAKKKHDSFIEKMRERFA